MEESCNVAKVSSSVLEDPNVAPNCSQHKKHNDEILFEEKVQECTNVTSNDEGRTSKSKCGSPSTCPLDDVSKYTNHSFSLMKSTPPQNKPCQVKTNINNNLNTNSEKESPQPSKRKLMSIKRRAGVLYKQLKSSKTNTVSSKYFSQAHNCQKRWIPPRSPYNLVQEDLFDRPWQLLVATIFLTKTAAKRALPQLHKFLARFPCPEDVLKANPEEIDEFFKPLGLTNTRSHAILRFTVEFLEKDWTYPRELFGIGKYGDDSYRMFCINEWRQVSPDDIPLSMYRNWLLENSDRLGLN